MVTGTFVVWESLARRRALAMSGPCQIPSLLPVV